MYEAHYGSTLIAKAQTRWGIRRKAKRWCKSRENKMMRQPKLGNIQFSQYDKDDLYRKPIQVKK